MIDVANLTKQYGPLMALAHIDLIVERGELFGLLGPNGAGKTTMIRIFTGQTKPSAGQVHIAGFDVQRDAVHVKQRIGLVPDVSNLYDEISVLDNLLFMAELYSVPRKERKPRAIGLLERVDLAPRRNQKVGTLSRGLKRRLTIAAALIHRPDLLILDEPTTGLDVQSATRIRHLITELNAGGTTIFLTTHYIEEANQLCQRVAIINKGHIMAVNSPEALKMTVSDQHVIDIAVTPPPHLTEPFQDVPGVVTVTRQADRFRLHVKDASEVIPSLIDYARANRMKIVSLNTVQPSLEDAFVRITGVSPEAMARDQDATKHGGNVN
jgi:ABC-2 type transport system ATP-binding protein